MKQIPSHIFSIIYSSFIFYFSLSFFQPSCNWCLSSAFLCLHPSTPTPTPTPTTKHQSVMLQQMSNLKILWCINMDYSGYGLSQWEMTLHRNVIPHWLSPYPEWPCTHSNQNALIWQSTENLEFRCAFSNVCLTSISLYKWPLVTPYFTGYTAMNIVHPGTEMLEKPNLTECYSHNVVITIYIRGGHHDLFRNSPWLKKKNADMTNVQFQWFKIRF